MNGVNFLSSRINQFVPIFTTITYLIIKIFSFITCEQRQKLALI